MNTALLKSQLQQLLDSLDDSGGEAVVESLAHTSADSYLLNGQIRLAYGVGEVAEALGVSKRFVDELVATNRIRSIKLGRRRLIPADELRRVVTCRESGQ